MKDTMEHPWQQVFNEGKTKWNISTRMLSGNLEGKDKIKTKKIVIIKK